MKKHRSFNRFTIQEDFEGEYMNQRATDDYDSAPLDKRKADIYTKGILAAGGLQAALLGAPAILPALPYVGRAALKYGPKIAGGAFLASMHPQIGAPINKALEKIGIIDDPQALTSDLYKTQTPEYSVPRFTITKSADGRIVGQNPAGFSKNTTDQIKSLDGKETYTEDQLVSMGQNQQSFDDFFNATTAANAENKIKKQQSADAFFNAVDTKQALSNIKNQQSADAFFKAVDNAKASQNTNNLIAGALGLGALAVGGYYLKKIYDKYKWKKDGCDNLKDPVQSRNCNIYILNNKIEDLRNAMNSIKNNPDQLKNTQLALDDAQDKLQKLTVFS